MVALGPLLPSRLGHRRLDPGALWETAVYSELRERRHLEVADARGFVVSRVPHPRPLLDRLTTIGPTDLDRVLP